MKKLLFVWIAWLLLTNNASAYSVIVSYQPKVFRTKEEHKIFDLFKQYCNQKECADTLWTVFDRKRYQGTDILIDILEVPWIKLHPKLHYTVCDIEQVDKRWILYYQLTSSTLANRICKAKVLVVVDDKNQYKLSNYINLSTENWSERQVGTIIYHYPKEHTFDGLKAIKAVALSDSLASWFSYKIEPINYFIFNDYKEGRCF